jgi:hypothetical protein
MQKIAATATTGLTAARRLPHVRDELDHVGLTNQAIAAAMAKGVRFLNHKDLQHRYFGLSMLRLVLKVRGDLMPDGPRNHGGVRPAAVNLAVFVNALRELKDVSTLEIPHDSATNRPDGDSED